jgi:proline iminopeptidase
MVFGLWKGEKKTPILVAHGGPGFSSMPEVVSEFAEQRPVYFYDQLGSRRSDKAKSKDDYSIEYFVTELGALLRLCSSLMLS